MKYLKYLQTSNDFESFKNSEDYVLPNISYIEETKGVSYEPYVQPFKMVDLGLPSGRLWCDRNVGSASSEDPGLYFQWGDTVGYTAEQIASGDKIFNWSSYFDTTNGGSTFNKYSDYKLKVLQPEDDAATVNMGAEYRMPTKADFNELINKCTVTFIDLQDNEYSKYEAENDYISGYNLKGIKFTGSNGNSIFIPASGSCGDNNIWNVNDSGDLWSSSLAGSSAAYFISFNNWGYLTVGDSYRDAGKTIRGVK